jgi:hypothetical protein
MSERGEGKQPGAVTKETVENRVVFDFKDAADAEEYLVWKQEVPLTFRRLVESAMRGTVATSSGIGLPLTDQFLNTLGQCLQAGQLVDLKGIPSRVANFLRPFAQVKTQGGYINIFETMTNQEASWSLKIKIYETQIKAALEWLANRDLADITKKAQEKAETSPSDEAAPVPQPVENDVPSTSEEVRSSMEAGMEKKEGQPATPLFSVKPFYGGYYRQLTFNRFDSTTLQWQKAENEFSESTPEAINPLDARVYFGKLKGGESLALPVPYDWVFDNNAIETDAPKGSMEVLRNQDGQWYLRVNSEGIFQYQLRLGKQEHFEEGEKFAEAEMTSTLPVELKQKIIDLQNSRLPVVKLKREIVKLVRNHLTYSNSRQAWERYTQEPREYFKRIWERKEADCKVANDLACQALAMVDNDFRYVTGFYVKEKGQDGEAVMHSGNGHAWLEIWDPISKRSLRLDATPKGDPTVDEEAQEKDLEGETGEGDYSASEEELASTEDTKKKLRELKKKEGNKNEQKKSVLDRAEENFAGLAECSPAQAREYLKALDRVREIKDENGMPVSDLMKEEWRKIVEERKITISDYRGPVRMDAGDRLEDPVTAPIDIRSREFNPSGFEKDERVEKIETAFGGIDVYFSFDLSGSMAGPDGASGRIKADVQRDAALLFVDGLMQCAYIGRQVSEETDLLPLKVMVTLATDTGKVGLHLTDKWTPKEQWAFYSALTRTASGGTPTHQTLQLIERDFDEELKDLRRKNIPPDKMPIQYTAEISDGAPDDFVATEQMHQRLKAKGMVVRSYTIGGESVSADATSPLSSFADLPKILGKDIVEVFKKLHPHKII